MHLSVLLFGRKIDEQLQDEWELNDGKNVTIHVPYKLDENGDLVLLNNANVELIKR